MFKSDPLSTQSLASCELLLWNFQSVPKHCKKVPLQVFDIVQFSRSCVRQPLDRRPVYFTTPSQACQALFSKCFQVLGLSGPLRGALRYNTTESDFCQALSGIFLLKKRLHFTFFDDVFIFSFCLCSPHTAACSLPFISPSPGIQKTRSSSPTILNNRRTRPPPGRRTKRKFHPTPASGTLGLSLSITLYGKRQFLLRISNGLCSSLIHKEKPGRLALALYGFRNSCESGIYPRCPSFPPPQYAHG